MVVGEPLPKSVFKRKPPFSSHIDWCLNAVFLYQRARSPLFTKVTLFFLHFLTYIFHLLYMVLLINDFFTLWGHIRISFSRDLSYSFFSSKSFKWLSATFPKHVELSLSLFCSWWFIFFYTLIVIFILLRK